MLWSKTSTASQWVREEARLARDRGKLIPVIIDGSAPPFGFGEIQAANLSHWNGDATDSNWAGLLLSAVERASAAQQTARNPHRRRARSRHPPPNFEPPPPRPTPRRSRFSTRRRNFRRGAIS